jgi:hypothetical protein
MFTQFVAVLCLLRVICVLTCTPDRSRRPNLEFYTWANFTVASFKAHFPCIHARTWWARSMQMAPSVAKTSLCVYYTHTVVHLFSPYSLTMHPIINEFTIIVLWALYALLTSDYSCLLCTSLWCMPRGAPFEEGVMDVQSALRKEWSPQLISCRWRVWMKAQFKCWNCRHDLSLLIPGQLDSCEGKAWCVLSATKTRLLWKNKANTPRNISDSVASWFTCRPMLTWR